MDLYLKFESEEQAAPYLYEVKTYTTDEPVNAIGNPESEYQFETKSYNVNVPKFANLDVIGTIYAPTGEFTEDTNGNKLPVMEALPGWHVNVRVVNEDFSEVQQFAINPKNPVRIWG